MEHDDGGSTRSLRMVQLGVLISLLSKPLVAVALPALFAAQDTRRALALPLAAYAGISLLFLLTPALNSGGYNGIHWLNVLNGASSRPLYSLVFPHEYDLAGCAEVYSLPAYLHRLTGAQLRSGCILSCPCWRFGRRARCRYSCRRGSGGCAWRRRRSCSAFCRISSATTWFGSITIRRCFRRCRFCGGCRAKERARLRRLLRIAFFVLLATFVPTPYCLAPQTPMRYVAASTMLRQLCPR